MLSTEIKNNMIIAVFGSLRLKINNKPEYQINDITDIKYADSEHRVWEDLYQLYLESYK